MKKYSLDEINSDAQLLEKIKRVDGSGSGLDADLLAGHNSSYLITPGTMIDFAGDSTPVGYLVCDGSEISKTSYQNLYNAIGDVWNTTGGVNAPSDGNFRLPPQEIDGLGLFHRGVGSTNGSVGTFQDSDANSIDWVGDGAWRGSGHASVDIPDDGSKSNYLQTGKDGGDYWSVRFKKKGTETRPSALTVLKCIKY